MVSCRYSTRVMLRRYNGVKASERGARWAKQVKRYRHEKLTKDTQCTVHQGVEGVERQKGKDSHLPVPVNLVGFQKRQVHRLEKHTNAGEGRNEGKKGKKE